MKPPLNPRRGFLLAGLAVPAGAVAGPCDDAALIALAREVVAAHRAYRASYEPEAVTLEEEEAREPEQDRLWYIAKGLAVRLAPMRPCTLAGCVAKAHAAAEMADHRPDGKLVSAGIGDLLALALVEDLAAMGGAT